MTWKLVICILTAFSHEHSGNIRLPESLERFANASEVLLRICETISSHSKELTLVFILHTTADFRTSFNYLWELPRAQLYLSTVYFPLKANDREITISWERDFKPKIRAMSEFWDIYKFCGSAHCEHTIPTVDQFHLEKRMLIQIRELQPYEWRFRHPAKIRKLLTESLPMNYYYHHYRSTFVLLRRRDEDRLHAGLTIKRTGRIVGVNVMELTATDFALSDAENVFDSAALMSNHSSRFGLAFNEISAADGSLGSVIPLESCTHNRITFVYAYSYLPVRLAVPVPWETQLISKLPRYISTELPLTIMSLFMLPWMLSIRRYRSFIRLPCMLGSSYHLVSGSKHDSVINTSNQGIVVLLICGLVSLLIQFPINLLKGEVISSPYEQRIHPSNCAVRSCESVQGRWSWFRKVSTSEFNIIRLADTKKTHQGRTAVTAANLGKGCSKTSLSTTGMLNWTQLAFLTQYHTICNEPELMRLQLNYFSRRLAFEHIPGSTESQPICSTGSSHGGHVSFEDNLRVSKQILEHDLLKYHHVKASLQPNDFFETRFWNRINPDPKWGDPDPLKDIIEVTIASLERNYQKLQMLGNHRISNIIKLQSVKFTFLTLFGTMLTLLLCFVLSKTCNSIIRHQQTSRWGP